MNFQDNFSDYTRNSYSSVYRQNVVPAFQNKVYKTEREALSAITGRVELIQSEQSGFIFNKDFNPEIMNYDANYQNEQSNSSLFQEHLNEVLRLLQSFGIEKKKVVEVGSGKGIFFEMLLAQGIDCWGFDPTYEGNNSRIIKEYFSEEYNDINADVIIMRHTLEHIPQPFSFIQTIAKANNYKGYLFVEVPTFDWIVKKNAFWDIFYEHCNYFTQQSLGVMFEEAITGDFFGGQYIYLWADLSKLRSTIPPKQKFTKLTDLVFEDKLAYYRDFLNKNQSLAIWGAGAKGSTFLNLLDAERKYVKYVIDINPAKQNRFIARTAHPIFSPAILKDQPVQNILIMNENYFQEINSIIDNSKFKLFNL